MASDRIIPSRAYIQGVLSLTLLGLFSAGMLLRIEPFASYYYAFAWWPFIVFLDALVLALQGHSLLSRNPREFLVLSAMSVPLWLVFEGWNVALQNWYYAGVHQSWLARRALGIICFATVLPAIFEATELVGALGIVREVHVRPIRVSAGLYAVPWLIGILFLASPLLFPKYSFPLIWLGFIFILEPFNHRWARGSLLREWEQGSMTMFVRLLIGGLICGFAWEMFNIEALTKWIYTVPFFEDLKLFEMPLAGFLGFPPFAVECYVIVQFVGIFRGGKGWEPGYESPLKQPPLGKPLRWVLILLVAAGCLGVFQMMDWHTNNSLLPRVKDLRSLAPEEVSRLQRAGIDRLDLWIRRPEKFRPALEESGLSTQAIERWECLAALASLKQMGTGNARMLNEVGIQSTEDLAKRDPYLLAERMRAVHDRTGWGRQAPRDAQVRVWVKAARKIQAIR